VRRFYAVALLAVAALAGEGVVHTVEGSATDLATTVPTTTVAASSSPYCRSNVLAGVHDPDRLQIMSPCAELDGDRGHLAPDDVGVTRDG